MHRHLVVVLATCHTIAAVTSPRAQERPLSTDRPDRTESPYTVPRGWIQVESDLATWGLIDGTDERVTQTAVITINAKYGLTRRIDLQVLFSPWVQVETEQTGLPDQSDSGTGQTGLRAKFNLFGNDSEGVALALLPFATVPTRGDAIFDLVTWGMVTPLSIPIGNDAAFSGMLGLTRIESDDYWVTASASLGTAIAGDLAGFLELYTSRNSFESDAIDDATIDAGLTFAPSENWQLDAGVYRGLASETEDWRVFFGASGRFPL